ncbi:hypothetical protein NA78x_000122 [Anatilimnocola sp. NA78]|uniref:hypothetical protein n=1 Tax=Anatilimnocola sp. NA78 TaxID=3415683 RepID=UPI003CE46FAE
MEKNPYQSPETDASLQLKQRQRSLKYQVPIFLNRAIGWFTWCLALLLIVAILTSAYLNLFVRPPARNRQPNAPGEFQQK